MSVLGGDVHHGSLKLVSGPMNLFETWETVSVLGGGVHHGLLRSVSDPRNFCSKLGIQ